MTAGYWDTRSYYDWVEQNYSSRLPSTSGSNSNNPVSATIANPDERPAAGKSIPVFLGDVRINGTIVWARRISRDGWIPKVYIGNRVAVCFGRNALQLPLTLKEIYVGGEKISLDGVTFYDGIGNTVSGVISDKEGVANTPAFTGYVYATLKDVKSTTDIVAVIESASGATPLPDLIERICAYSEIQSAEIVTQNLSGYSVNGMLLSSSAGSADLLNRLAEMYTFDFVESDGKLKFTKKRTGAGTTVDAVIPVSDLVETETETVRVIKNSGFNTLNSVTVEFVDKEKNYELNTVTAERPLGNSFTSTVRRSTTVSAPICIPMASAKSLVYEVLYSVVRGSSVYNIVLPPGWIHIEPGDVISVAIEGATKILSVTTTTIRENGSTELEAILALDSGNTNVTVDPDFPADTDGGVADVVIIPLDIPMLLPEHDLVGAGYVKYHALTTYDTTNTWYGSYNYSSLDDMDYRQVSQWPPAYPPTAVGTAQNVIGEPLLPFATDTVNQLQVTITGGSSALLASSTYADVLNRLNGCAAYGDHGRWEIIAWETATVLAGGDVVLSNLQRGLLGSEQHCGTHLANDRFVYINWVKPTECAGRLVADMPLTQLNKDTWFSAKPPSSSYTITNNKVMETTLGTAEKPYAPVQLAGTKDGSDNITLTWVRRSRLNQTVLTSIVNAPLAEATEKYEVEIMNGATVLRTLMATSQSVAYSAANALADFGAAPTSLTFKVYQISATVGRGYAGTATIAL